MLKTNLHWLFIILVFSFAGHLQASDSCPETSQTYQDRYERSFRTSDLVCMQRALERELSGQSVYSCNQTSQFYQERYERTGRNSDLVCMQEVLGEELSGRRSPHRSVAPAPAQPTSVPPPAVEAQNPNCPHPLVHYHFSYDAFGKEEDSRCKEYLCSQQASYDKQYCPNQPPAGMAQIKYCQAIAGLAGSVMKARQNGTDFDLVMDTLFADPNADDNEYSLLILMEAWTELRHRTEKERQDAVADFESKWYLYCLNNQ